MTPGGKNLPAPGIDDLLKRRLSPTGGTAPTGETGETGTTSHTSHTPATPPTVATVHTLPTPLPDPTPPTGTTPHAPHTSATDPTGETGVMSHTSPTRATPERERREPPGMVRKTYYVSEQTAAALAAAVDRLYYDSRGRLTKHEALGAIIAAGVAQVDAIAAELGVE